MGKRERLAAEQLSASSLPDKLSGPNLITADRVNQSTCGRTSVACGKLSILSARLQSQNPFSSNHREPAQPSLVNAFSFDLYWGIRAIRYYCPATKRRD